MFDAQSRRELARPRIGFAGRHMRHRNRAGKWSGLITARRNDRPHEWPIVGIGPPVISLRFEGLVGNVAGQVVVVSSVVDHWC